MSCYTTVFKSVSQMSPPFITIQTCQHYQPSIGALLLTMYFALFGFTGFSNNVLFFSPGSTLSYYIPLHHYVSSVSSYLFFNLPHSFSTLPYTCWPWQLWAALVRSFLDCASVWVHVIYSSWLDWKYVFLERIPEMVGLLHSFVWRVHNILGGIQLDLLVKVVFSRLFSL